MRKLLFAFLALAACTDSKSTTPPGDDDGSGSGSGSGSGDVSDADKQQDADDVAASIGANLTAGDMGAIVDAINMAYGRNPAGFTIQNAPDYQLLTGTKAGLMVQYKLY